MKPEEYEIVAPVIAGINAGLTARYESDTPLTTRLHANADLQIVGFEPVTYVAYDRLFNRGPNFLGLFSLRHLIARPESRNKTKIYQVIGATRKIGYGFEIDDRESADIDMLAKVVRELGRTGFSLFV